VSAPIEVELSTLAEKDWVFVASHLPVPLMERSVPGLAGMLRCWAFPRFPYLLPRTLLSSSFLCIITYPLVFLFRNRGFERLGHFTANLREWDKCSF